MHGSQRTWPTTIIVPTLAIALYAVTLGGTFVYDDVAVVQTDRRIADPHLWGEYWTDSYNFGVDNLYRPIASMTYAAQHWIHGETAWPYHLVNVLLHGVASGMVAWVAYRFSENLNSRDATRRASNDDRASRSATPGIAAIDSSRSIALIAGLLFAAHPVHVEAVANIVGRAELLCAIGTLGAIGLALEPLAPRRVAAIAAFFILALLSKEQGMLVPLMVAVVSWFRWRDARVAREPREAADRASTTAGDASVSATGPLLFVALTLPLAAYVFLKENVLHLKFWWDRIFLDRWIQPLSDSVGWDRAMVPITIAGRYLGLLVVPVTLRIDYGGQIVPGVFRANDPFFWLGLLAIALWVGLMIVALRRRDRLLVVALLLFAISYSVVSNALTIIGVNVAERLIYLPSALFVIVVARLLTMLPRRAMPVVVSATVLLFSVRTVTYAWRWNDRLAFYQYAARVEPRSMKAILLAMQEYADRGELADAERYGRQATTLDPTYQDAWLRLAEVLIDRGDLDGAAAAIEHARAIDMTARVGKAIEKLAGKRPAATRP